MGQVQYNTDPGVTPILAHFSPDAFHFGLGQGTIPNTFTMGAPAGEINTMILGAGDLYNSLSQPSLFRTSNQQGTNQTGYDIGLQAGLSTGSAYGGTVNIYSNAPGPAGFTLNTAARFAAFGPITQVIGDIDVTGNGVALIVDDPSYLYTCLDGIIRGTDFHNNTNVAQGNASGQDIRSGTYTPTLTAVTNVTSTTSRKAQWMRVGNVVTVSGQFDVTPTGIGLTVVGISLPVASNFGTAYECGGAGHAPTVAGHGASIYADATNNRAELSYVDTVGSADTMTYTFTYEVI